jgi:predicted TIM-barrel fold metal-dependent hydrolase
MDATFTRRRLLCGAAAMVPAGAEAAQPTRIIDTHTHFYDPSRPGGVPWPPKTDPVLYKTVLPSTFRAAVKGLGVTGTVVVEASALLEDNQWVLDLAKNDPVIVGVVGHLTPGTPEFAGHLERFGKDRLFRGIRLGGKAIAAGVSRKEFLDDLERLSNSDLELDAIGGRAMFPDVLRLSDRVPDLRIVLNHLPVEGGDAVEDFAKRPQIYAKVSGVLRKEGGRVPEDVNFYREGLDRIWTVFGPERVIYGSNWPVSNLLAPYGAVLKVVREYFDGKGREAVEGYFWRNAAAAYKWVHRRG